MRIIRTAQGSLAAVPRPAATVGGGFDSYCFEEYSETNLSELDTYTFGSISITLEDDARVSLIGYVEAGTPAGCGLTGRTITVQAYYEIDGTRYTPTSTHVVLEGVHQRFQIPVQTMIDLEAGDHDFDLIVLASEGSSTAYGAHFIALVGNVVEDTTACATEV